MFLRSKFEPTIFKTPTQQRADLLKVVNGGFDCPPPGKKIFTCAQFMNRSQVFCFGHPILLHIVKVLEVSLGGHTVLNIPYFNLLNSQDHIC